MIAMVIDGDDMDEMSCLYVVERWSSMVMDGMIIDGDGDDDDGDEDGVWSEKCNNFYQKI